MTCWSWLSPNFLVLKYLTQQLWDQIGVICLNIWPLCPVLVFGQSAYLSLYWHFPDFLGNKPISCDINTDMIFAKKHLLNHIHKPQHTHMHASQLRTEFTSLQSQVDQLCSDVLIILVPSLLINDPSVPTHWGSTSGSLRHNPTLSPMM